MVQYVYPVVVVILSFTIEASQLHVDYFIIVVCDSEIHYTYACT